MNSSVISIFKNETTTIVYKIGPTKKRRQSVSAFMLHIDVTGSKFQHRFAPGHEKLEV